jgi:hypothetical protein
VQSLCRQRILYKANGMQFQIKDIIGTRDGIGMAIWDITEMIATKRAV